MATFNIHEAKTHFSRLVEEAASGKEVVIAKAGKPVAKLVAFPEKGARRGRRKLGILEGKAIIPDDFDAPLPDEILSLFYEGPIFPDTSKEK
jgi:prevent-host-death family protein